MERNILFIYLFKAVKSQMTEEQRLFPHQQKLRLSFEIITLSCTISIFFLLCLHLSIITVFLSVFQNFILDCICTKHLIIFTMVKR